MCCPSSGTLNLKYLAIAVNTTLGVADSATTLEPKYCNFDAILGTVSHAFPSYNFQIAAYLLFYYFVIMLYYVSLLIGLPIGA